MYEIFVNSTCINHKPVNLEHKLLSQGGSILTGFTVSTTQQTRYTWIQTLDNNWKTIIYVITHVFSESITENKMSSQN